MHELADTEHILEVTLQQARQAGAQRVTALYLVLGEQSSITEDSVRFYWESLSRDTPAEGAALHFRRVPAEWLCLDCDWRDASEPTSGACPACNSPRIRIEGGEEFYLEAIDIEPEENGAREVE